MGDVWRGRHLALGHEAAIKVLKPESARNTEIVQRFAREARIAAQLRHRHIARVEDFGVTPEGVPWLVMELLHGESLEERIEREVKLDHATVITVARHVGAACDAAHAAGIVHRDLKPSNCFLVREEDGTLQVKVLDFGVAKASDGLKLTGHGAQLLGTPLYMSPEQTQSPSSIDGRSDLWSLGVMVYELLTGELPFLSESLPGLLVAIGMGPIKPPTAVNPALPKAIDAWVAKALERNRERRYQTGRELADALAAALQARPADTRIQHAAPTVSGYGPTVQAPVYSTPTAPSPAPSYPFIAPHPAMPAPSFAGPMPAWSATVPGVPLPPRSRSLALLLAIGAVVLFVSVASLTWALRRQSSSPPLARPSAITATPAPPALATPPPSTQPEMPAQPVAAPQPALRPTPRAQPARPAPPHKAPPRKAPREIVGPRPIFAPPGTTPNLQRRLRPTSSRYDPIVP